MSRNALIIFATGLDRPGIVDRMAGLAYESGCNLEDSRMAILGEDFALIVLVAGLQEDLSRLKKGLEPLSRELGLTIQVKDTVAGSRARTSSEPAIRYRIHAVAMDHPGILHKLTHVLSAHRVNVASCDTSLCNAPVTGTPVFSVRIDAEVPAGVAISVLRKELAQVAEAENVDLELRAAE